MTGGGDPGPDASQEESLLPPVMAPPAGGGQTGDPAAVGPAATARQDPQTSTPAGSGIGATTNDTATVSNAGRGVSPPATGTSGRSTGAAAATPPPPPPPPPPAVPTTGTVRVGGRLPAGTQVTATSADGRSRTLQSGANILPAGSYNVEARASGYVTARTVLSVSAGETETWTPDLRAVQPDPTTTPPPPPPPPPPPSSPTVGGAEAEAAVRGAIDGFVAAFAQRQTSILPLLPANERANWTRLFESGRSVTDMQASVTRYGTPDFQQAAATVEFSLRYSFRQQGASIPPQEPRYAASLERTATGAWRIASLRRVN
jgi:hypothetical protein